MTDTIASDLVRLAVIAVGLVLGYGVGRYIWSRFRVAVAPFPIIASVAIVGLVSSRLFAAAGMSDAWQTYFFPLAVSIGAGFSVTNARPPRQSLWWQLWRS
jgi:hypothetical protein